MSSPPSTGRHSTARPAGAAGAGQRSSRRFFLAVSWASASSSNPGATITSVKMSASCAAIAAVTTPLAAITPP